MAPTPTGRRAPSRWWIAVLVGSAVIVAAVGVIAVLGALIVRVSVSEPRAEIRQLPLVEGAPEADFVMNVRAVGASGKDVDWRLVNEGGLPMTRGNVLVAGSAVHVADVATPFEDVSIYRWSEVEASTEPDVPPSSCFGGFAESTSFTGCQSGEPGITGPSVSWGSSSGGGSSSYSATVIDLPAETAWVRVSTASGGLVASPVVDGVAHLEWPGNGRFGAGAEPHTVEALDSSHEQIWSQAVQ